jgi:hypothetical protein
MLMVYSALLIVIASLVIPVVLDHIRNHGGTIHWSRRLAAYGVMTFFSMAFPLFTGLIHFDIISAFLAVAVAVMITEISAAGTALLLTLTTIVFPVSVLYALSIMSGINNPAAAILDKMEWHFLFLPLISGIAALIITKALIRKWNWKKA